MSDPTQPVHVPVSLFESAFQHCPDPAVMADSDGMFVLANEAAGGLFGLPREQLPGRTMTEFLVDAGQWHGFTSGSPARGEVLIRKAGGIETLAEFAAVLDLAPGIHVAYLRDIGSRRLTEEQLRTSEERYKELADFASDIIYTVDLDGMFRAVNGAIERILGYSVDEVIGRMKVSDLVPPESLPEALEQSQKKLSGETDVTTYRLPLQHRDGTLRLFEITSRVIDSLGVRGIHGIARDITDRAAAEQALMASERRFERVVETAPCGIWIFNGEAVTYANAALAEMLGYPVGQLTAPGFFGTLFTDEDRAFVVERGRRRLAGESVPDEYELRIMHADGSSRTLSVRGTVIEFDGRASLLVTAFDITGQKAAEAQRLALEAKLQQTQKLESLGLLAGGIAHDFNNLLLGMLGNSDVALLLLPAESPARPVVADIQLAAHRAADLTRQMLAYSGRGKFTVESLVLSRLVEEMSHLLEVSILKRASVRYRLAPDLPPVLGDATQLRQVIMNLMINAADAIGDRNGVISVSTGVTVADRTYLQGMFVDEDLPEGEYVYLDVSDTGVGMDADTVARIFDPFFTTKFTGRGLGLAAVLGIVRGHRGAIKVYSEPGRGTTMKVLLPRLVEDPPESLVAPSTALADTSWRHEATVLLIDDDETVRDVARRMLELAGMRVVDCESGEEGIATFGRLRSEVSVVLLDLTMPDLDGEEVYRQLRMIDPKVKVVLISGYSENDVTDRFAGKGLAGFIQKPFQYRDLVSHLRQVLDERDTRS